MVASQVERAAIRGQIDGCAGEIDAVAQRERRIAADVNWNSRIADDDAASRHRTAEGVGAIGRHRHRGIPDGIIGFNRSVAAAPTNAEFQIAVIIRLELIGMNR